ncbi:MAG: pectin acetylesterase-family hydrolase [Pseudomonadota bacterium]
MKTLRRIIAGAVSLGLSMGAGALAGEEENGLNTRALKELANAGLFKYVNQNKPISSEPFGDGWIKHTFDAKNGKGPICIAGTDYSVFTRTRDPEKLIIFLQGGGACWEGLTACNITAEAQFPVPDEDLRGILAQTRPDGSENEFADWSIAYMPYCDGSVFGGDNDVENDPNFGVRRHRGLRNLTAGMDVARDVFGKSETILLTGSSAGGVGASAFAPFLARFLFGNERELMVFNDAGPLALDSVRGAAAAAARSADWRFDQFYPQSCIDQGLCDPFGQQTGIIAWRLANDLALREAFFETDGDLTNIGFASVNLPGFPPFFEVSQFDYRLILEGAHDPINDAFPDRYRRFLVSGANPACNGLVVRTHTALQGGDTASFGCPQVDLFYDLSVDGVPLFEWTSNFVNGREGWDDLVEPFAPTPF